MGGTEEDLRDGKGERCLGGLMAARSREEMVERGRTAVVDVIGVRVASVGATLVLG